MSEERRNTGATAARGDVYVFGDEEAGGEVGLPSTEIRKMRIGGLLEGAYAKIGPRSIIYHRSRLRQRLDEALAKGGIDASSDTPGNAA
jgi:hypothetical protein